MRKPSSRRYPSSLFAVVLVALIGCFGCGGGDSKGGGGDPEMVGTWVGTEVGQGPAVWTFTFAATTIDVASEDGEGYKGTYSADTTSNPKRMTGSITECFYAPYVGKTSHAIYKIEGTTMTFAGNEPGNPAVPTSFNTGGTARVYLLERQ